MNNVQYKMAPQGSCWQFPSEAIVHQYAFKLKSKLFTWCVSAPDEM
jgi:hypothetical protein